MEKVLDMPLEVASDKSNSDPILVPSNEKVLFLVDPNIMLGFPIELTLSD